MRGKLSNDIVEIYWQLLRALGFDDGAELAKLGEHQALQIDCEKSRGAIEWMRTLVKHGA